ncbi:hypothetical protein BU16DRAFT_524534 [Lophium mytilinum]|uniref:F-box domain-containing protein n=1 Tax=Lophium mytilinum TaxID=390894 RepID=A0A6A6R3C7_9PEZI|nr:hypothetical protein BU16DRAFT_524534 [Lophium mytilinum]
MANPPNHPSPSPQPCSNLPLPTELRFSILQHVLQHHDNIQISNFVADRIAYEKRYRRLLSLAAVSKEFRVDAFTVFASTNVFEATGGLSLTHLLKTLSPLGRANLVHLKVVFPAALGLIDVRELKAAIPMLAAECPKVKLTLSLHATYLRRLSGPHVGQSTRRAAAGVGHISRTPGALLLKQLAGFKGTELVWCYEARDLTHGKFRREAEVWLADGQET